MLFICVISFLLGAVCSFIPSASFGAFFFLSLGIALLGLVICIKISNSNLKCSPFFNIIAIIGRLLFTLWLISFIIIESFIFLGEKSDEDVQFDVLIVLGAGIIEQSPSLAFKARLDTAILYLNENPDTLVITTGGFGANENYSEAYVAKKYLIEKGILENRILLEEKSTNTFDNIKYAKELLPDDFSGNVCAVSNNFHLFRARLLLNSHGFTNYAIGTEIPTYKTLNILYSIREYFSVVKYLLLEI